MSFIYLPLQHENSHTSPHTGLCGTAEWGSVCWSGPQGHIVHIQFRLKEKVLRTRTKGSP